MVSNSTTALRCHQSALRATICPAVSDENDPITLSLLARAGLYGTTAESKPTQWRTHGACRFLQLIT